jgi:hypothetical protein
MHGRRDRSEDRVGEVEKRVMPAAHSAVQPLAKTLRRREKLRYPVETRRLLRVWPDRCVHRQTAPLRRRAARRGNLVGHLDVAAKVVFIRLLHIVVLGTRAYCLRRAKNTRWNLFRAYRCFHGCPPRSVWRGLARYARPRQIGCSMILTHSTCCSPCHSRPGLLRRARKGSRQMDRIP